MTREDGHGNTLTYLNWEEFQEHFTNSGMWMKGDEVVVKNKDGSVIGTYILTENAEEVKNLIP